jgi:1-acyl-sn-glycerol-3-phosphate acyltransferase
VLGVVARVLAPRHRVTGQIHVPRRGGVLLCPNHIADADPPFLLNASPRPLWFMAKRELFAMRFPILGEFGPIIRWCGAFPVDPGEPDRDALRHAGELLKAGGTLAVFPEGKIAHDGEMGEVLPGAVLIALRSKVPIVPVGIWGTQHVVPYGQMLPRPTRAKVHVHFAAPITFDDLASLPKREQRQAATERLEAAMRVAREVAKHGGMSTC